jgi:hypothetical protein
MTAAPYRTNRATSRLMRPGAQVYNSGRSEIRTSSNCRRFRSVWSAAAGLFTAALICSALAAAAQPVREGPVPADADRRVAVTRAFLSRHDDCAAHRSLRWLSDVRPRGIYDADGELAARRYRTAFLAYRGVVAASRIDDPRHPAALDRVLELAASGSYRDAVAAIPEIPPPVDDLTELISGAVYYAAGQRAPAKAAWIAGVGRGAVPGGSPLYRGPSLSVLFLLDHLILGPECTAR